MPVIEPVAVANVEALLAAIAPDGELDEPGKDLRKTAVELPSVDLLGSTGNDFGAAACPVAAGAVGMGSLELSQDPGPMQEIVDQRINRNQVHADFQPPRANVSGADQNAGQGHGQHLVGNAVDIAQRFNQGLPDALEPVGGGFVGRQPVVDPADQVAIGNVANNRYRL